MYLVIGLSMWQPNFVINSYQSVNTLSGYFPIVILLHHLCYTQLARVAKPSCRKEAYIIATLPVHL